jgi:uncharacterized membrane protein YjgN (DUF898 family)
VAAISTMAGVVPPSPQPTDAKRLLFNHEPGRFARIAIRNAVLGLVTLGLYRFWGKTQVRRHLWSHVSLAGEPFEYLGTGKELFLGFLVALAVLLPIFFARSLADLFLVGRDEDLAWAIDGIFLLGIYFLIQVAVYRARRYRLSRTMWRGVRAGQTGSAWRYGLAALGYGLLTVVTLGLAYPVLRLRLFGLRMNHTWFGDRRFSFVGRARSVLRPWLVAWGTAVLFIGLFAVLVGNLPEAGETDAASPVKPNVYVIGALAVAGVAAVPLLLVLYVGYRAAEFRYCVRETRFEGLRFRSELTARRIIWIHLSFLLAVLGLFLATGMIIGGGLWALGLAAADAATAEGMPAIAWVVIVPAGLFLLIGLSVLKPVLVMHPLARRLCATLSATGEVDFEAIAQSDRAAPGRGEGLADMLDVGSF